MSHTLEKNTQRKIYNIATVILAITWLIALVMALIQILFGIFHTNKLFILAVTSRNGYVEYPEMDIVPYGQTVMFIGAVAILMHAFIYFRYSE